MPEYTVVDVTGEQVDLAYLLARAADPALDPDQWLASLQLLDGSGGMLGLSGPAGTLLGLLTWRKQQMPRYGTTLTIEKLVVVELARLGSGRLMLLDAARALAERLHCSAFVYPDDNTANR